MASSKSGTVPRTLRTSEGERSRPATPSAFCERAGVGRLAFAAMVLWSAALLTSPASTAELSPEGAAAMRDECAMALICAREDRHFRTLIDDLFETGEATVDELVVAAFLHRQANIACLRRDFPAAFEIFGAISLPTATLSLLEDLRAAEWLAADRAPRRTGH